MPRLRKIIRPELLGQPFRLIIDFPSYDDANCARELLEPLALGPITLRAKDDYFRPTTGQSPRMRAMRRALASHRSFDREMIGEALEECGYSSTVHTIGNFTELAIKHGVIKRLEPGLFEFLPLPTGAVATSTETPPHAPLCLSCQPEPLSCHAI